MSDKTTHPTGTVESASTAIQRQEVQALAYASSKGRILTAAHSTPIGERIAHLIDIGSSVELNMKGVRVFTGAAVYAMMSVLYHRHEVERVSLLLQISNAEPGILHALTLHLKQARDHCEAEEEKSRAAHPNGTIEAASIAVPLLRTLDGEPTCALHVGHNHTRCPFLRVKGLEMSSVCALAWGGIYADKDGRGFLRPAKDCPVHYPDAQRPEEGAVPLTISRP